MSVVNYAFFMKKIWSEIEIFCPEKNLAIAPVIISASRATDIPAFFFDDFINNLKKGYCEWTNPFNNKKSIVSFNNTRLIVFWTKNPENSISKLNYLIDNNINFYFQFTLNNYEQENYEQDLPLINQRIFTFKQLSEKIGKEKVIWRYDPLILSDKIEIDDLIYKLDNIGNELIKFTNKLVFSFVDIQKYQKVQKRSKLMNLREFTEIQKFEFAQKLNILFQKWKKINPDFKIATCAEEISLEKFSISHNSCIDFELIKNIFAKDYELLNFLNSNIKNLKDKGQRKNCNCIVSKDIGVYNSCKHKCIYCYATK